MMDATLLATILVNVGYFLMTVALSVRDILWLRVIFLSAHSSLCSYALITGKTDVAVWNGLFVVVNSMQVARVVRERRPIELPAHLLDIYEKVFAGLRRREFLYFWDTGTVTRANDALLVKQGQPQDKLALVLEGTVQVVSEGAVVAELDRGSFFGEMSFFTGKPASADVLARGSVEYIAWPQRKLHDLETLNPRLYLRLHRILGKDLTEKVRADVPGEPSC